MHAGQQHQGLVGRLAQEEAAERPFHAQDVLLLHRAEDVVGELAAGHVADVQLDGWRRAQQVRRVGHAVAAPGTVAQDELHVLAGAVLQVLVGRQLELQHRHVSCRLLKGQHPRRQLEYGELPRPWHAARLHHAIRLRRGAAGEDETRGLLVGRQRLLLVRAVDDAALEKPTLAGAAGAVTAAIGQADALADGGSQDALVTVDGEAALGRLQGHGQAHGVGQGILEADDCAPAHAPAPGRIAPAPSRLPTPASLIRPPP